MDDRTSKLLVGVLLFAGAALVLLGSVLPAVELPVATYALIAFGLFGGVYLIGISYPDRTV